MKHARRRVESEKASAYETPWIWCGIPNVIATGTHVPVRLLRDSRPGSMLNTIEPWATGSSPANSPPKLKPSAATWWSSRTPDHWLQQENSGRFGGDYLIKRLIGPPGITAREGGPASRSRSTAWPSTKLRTSAPAWTPAPSRSVKK